MPGTDGGATATADARAKPSAPAPLLASMGAQGLMTLAAQPGAVAPPLASLAAYGAAGAGPAGVLAADEVQAPAIRAAAPVVTASLSDSLAFADPAGALPAGDAESGEPEETPAAAPREQEPVDEYAARLLHIYQGADGVQAWVRDAALNAAQSLLLARGMAQELNGAGNRLSALTVNGKKISADGASHTINSKGAV
jgi:hypothetical protein